jgi:hypothetical protein
MRQIICVCIILMLGLLAACGNVVADTGAVAKSDLARELAPAIPAANAHSLQDGNSAFAFDFYHQVSAQDGNMVYSPYSITLAAAMLYGGAGGETASQIASSLHFNLPPAQLHPALNALALNTALPGTLYAGTMHGVFKTTDGGKSWRTTNSSLDGSMVFALAIDPLNPDTIYAGTAGEGVFKTSDAGAHWEAINTGLTTSKILTLLISPVMPDTLFAGTNGGGVFVLQMK